MGAGLAAQQSAGRWYVNSGKAQWTMINGLARRFSEEELTGHFRFQRLCITSAPASGRRIRSCA